MKSCSDCACYFMNGSWCSGSVDSHGSDEFIYPISVKEEENGQYYDIATPTSDDEKVYCVKWADKNGPLNKEVFTYKSLDNGNILVSPTGEDYGFGYLCKEYRSVADFYEACEPTNAHTKVVLIKDPEMY